MSEHICCACSEPEGDQCMRKSGTVTKTDWQNIIVIFLNSCSTQILNLQIFIFIHVFNCLIKYFSQASFA
jgi:hypothetical protein